MKNVSAALLVALMSAPVLSQAPARPDFSGEWVIDPARTNTTGMPEHIGMGATGRRGGPPDPAAPRAVVTPPQKTVHVSPVYPPDAQRSRTNGVVMLEATIDAAGNVVDLVPRGERTDFDDAAIRAVSQWRYRPATRDGQPIPVIMTVLVTFTIDASGPRPIVVPPPGGRGSGRGGGAGAGLGPVPETLRIRQDAVSLRIERPGPSGRETATYRFDGRRVTNRLTGMGGLAAGSALTFVSSWSGDKLSTQIAWDVGNASQNRLETIWLEGDSLVVELGRPPLASGGEPIVRRTFYTKR